jgi:hypothetical protein
VDAVARFLLDPFAEHRWGPYAGGGVSVRFDAHERGRSYLLLLLGIEGAPGPGIVPAVELGVGGGWRAGVVLRRGREDRR